MKGGKTIGMLLLAALATACAATPDAGRRNVEMGPEDYIPPGREQRIPTARHATAWREAILSTLAAFLMVREILR